METYEMLSGKLELYCSLDEGRAAAKAGHLRSYEDVFRDIERETADGLL